MLRRRKKNMVGGNSHRAYCKNGCGVKTFDWTGVCSRCRISPHRKLSKSKRGYISIEELERREMMDCITLNIQEGWFYPDEDEGKQHKKQIKD